jgi:hypothetical protein
MSQRNVLTREQARVRALLERYPHVSHSAVDVARHFGMDVRTAVVALRELRRRGYARRGPARASRPGPPPRRCHGAIMGRRRGPHTGCGGGRPNRRAEGDR